MRFDTFTCFVLKISAQAIEIVFIEQMALPHLMPYLGTDLVFFGKTYCRVNGEELTFFEFY